MRNSILMLVFFLGSMCSLHAQDDTKSSTGGSAQSVYGEIGGSGLFFSGNYDFLFKGQKGLGGRVGFGFFGVTGASVITVPVGLNYLIGNTAPSYFQIGFSATYVTGSIDIGSGTASSGGMMYLPSIGYRYAPKDKGVTGQIYVGPIIIGGQAVFPFGGIAFGYKFK